MNSKQLDLESTNKLFKKGQDALKTSFFTFKFKPDHLSAVHYFTDAGKSYRKLNKFKESIMAFQEAIKCNKELLESWAEAQNWQEISEIYIFNLSDFNSGWKALQNSSMGYKYAGKFTTGIKVYTDTASKLMESQNKQHHAQAMIILSAALEDCFDQTHDELARVSMEDTFNKILDVYCSLEKYVDAINTTEKYIKIQKSIKEEKKHKISKNYLRLAMLRIIIDEVYMAENVVDEMLSAYDSSCGDDIDDLRKLIKSFKEANKKDFNYSVTYAFSLFQNNLLKALRKAFEAKLEISMNNRGAESVNNNINNIPIRNVSYVDNFNEPLRIVPMNNRNPNQINIENVSVGGPTVLDANDETRAQSELGESDNISNLGNLGNLGTNNNGNSGADDYL